MQALLQWTGKKYVGHYGISNVIFVFFFMFPRSTLPNYFFNFLYNSFEIIIGQAEHWQEKQNMKKSQTKMNRRKAGQPRNEVAREMKRISPEIRERIRSQIMKGKSKLEITEELGISLRSSEGEK